MKKFKGFTLVELVIVIIIVGILSLVAVPIYKKYVEQAKVTEAKTSLDAIRKAYTLYNLETGSTFGTAERAAYLTDIGIDLRNNKYFTAFRLVHGNPEYGQQDSLMTIYLDAKTVAFKDGDIREVLLIFSPNGKLTSIGGWGRGTFKIPAFLYGYTENASYLYDFI